MSAETTKAVSVKATMSAEAMLPTRGGTQTRSQSAAKETRAIARSAKPPTFSNRLIYGAIAGFLATAPMTAVMHRLHRKLDRGRQYPLPPREIVGSVLPEIVGEPANGATLAAHFAYGALSGAALSAIGRKPTIGGGVAGGLAIWLASYMGWIPAFNILKPATRHPSSRNALMMFAHVVWGSAFAVAQRDLLNARPAFSDGPLKDAA